MSKSVQIIGCTAVNRKLRSFEARVGKKVIRQSLRQAAKPVQVEIKQEAPKESGQMAKSVKIRSGGRDKMGAIIIRIILSKSDLPKFYAAFKNLGTKKMKADPFMQRSANAKRSEAIKIARELIVAGVEREARG